MPWLDWQIKDASSGSVSLSAFLDDFVVEESWPSYQQCLRQVWFPAIAPLKLDGNITELFRFNNSFWRYGLYLFCHTLWQQPRNMAWEQSHFDSDICDTSESQLWQDCDDHWDYRLYPAMVSARFKMQNDYSDWRHNTHVIAIDELTMRKQMAFNDVALRRLKVTVAIFAS